MFDYKLLLALDAVIRQGSFDKAASLLNITPSAVSQRIRQLEEKLGQMLVVRSTPTRATSAGHRLLRHVRQVGLLEEELRHELAQDEADSFIELPVGLNNDSLNTWFVDAVASCVLQEKLLLQITVDDEAHTQQLLKQGEVIGCLTSSPQPPTGCVSHPLGIMRYRCVASPTFARHYFADSVVNRASMMAAPGIIFNRKDTLHLGFLQSRFGVEISDFPSVIMPGVHSLLQGVKNGLGYGICPELQVVHDLAAGQLIDLFPHDPPSVMLYWQCWALQSPRLERFTRHLLTTAAERLAPSSGQ